jgi:hypothetical protein
MSTLFYPPHAYIPSGTGLPQAGLLAYFYVTATSTPKNTYSDFALTTPNANPVVADANGVWPAIYLDSDINYRVTIRTALGVLVYTQDDVPGPLLTQAAIGAILYPRSADEITAGVTPTDLSKTYDNPQRFGAVLNGTVDDTVAFSNISAAMAVHGGVVRFTGTPLFNSANLLIPENVTWEGPQGSPGISGYHDATVDANNNTGTYVSSGTILLNPAYTINVHFKASLKKCTILNKILGPSGIYPLPFRDSVTALAAIAAFSGTAITQTGSDARVEDVLVLGFAQLFYSTGQERTYLRRVFGDNTAGIWIDQSTSVAMLQDCHMWAFLTTHHPWSQSASAFTRAGSAFKVTNHLDGGMFFRCFEYAYAIGFDMQSNNSIHMTDCASDSDSSSTGQTGFKFTAATELVCMMNCKSSGKDQGLYVNVTPAVATGAIDVIGGAYFGNFAHFVSDNHRTITFSGTHFRDTTGGSRTAVTLNAGVTGTTNITGCTFEGVNHAYSIAAGLPAENCRRWNNTYAAALPNVPEDRMLADGTGNNVAYSTTYNASTGGASYRHRHASGSVAATGISPVNAAPWTVRGDVHDGSVFSPLALIRISAHGGAPAAGNTPGAVIIATNRSGSTLTDTFVVGEDGFIFPAVDNSVKCGKTGLRWSEVWAANGTIQTSDERAKVDIQPSALGLAFIESLRPVSYRWLIGGNRVTETAEDGSVLGTEPIPGVRTHWGLVAQEVKRAIDAAGVKDFAGWVLDDKDDPNSTQSLRYDQFVGPLVKAVQELSARIEQLEAAQPGGLR